MVILDVEWVYSCGSAFHQLGREDVNERGMAIAIIFIYKYVEK